MKKLITLFLITYIFSYANYLITNSEIVLFYDKEYNSIKYIRGDVFNKTDISKLEGSLILNNEEIISLNKYFIGAEMVTQNNILKLNYRIKEKDISVYIVPSMSERDKLYFKVELGEFKREAKNIDFALKIIPQYENRYVDFNEKNSSYSYDDFYIKAENYQGKLYITRDSQLEDLNLEEVKNKVKKYQDDGLYYIVKDIEKERDLVLVIKFYQEFQKDPQILNQDIFANEIDYWEKNDYDNKFTEKKVIFRKELENLQIMSSRSIIPNRIDYTKSEKNLNTKIKLYYLNTLYDKGFNTNKLFEDINIRKSENEAIIYYTFLFRYLNDSENTLNGNLLKGKIMPEVLSLLDYLEEVDDEVINIRNNINSYYWYYQLIEAIQEREEFQSEREFIKNKKEFLLNYLNRNFVSENGLKSRKNSKRVNYKNIKYIDFLPQEEQLKLLRKDYKENYNSRYGVLIHGKDVDRIDLNYNLAFISKLYKNGESFLADKLFFNIKNYIKRNNYYVSNYIYLTGDNIPGIDGETLYLYFIAEEYREKYGD